MRPRKSRRLSPRTPLNRTVPAVRARRRGPAQRQQHRLPVRKRERDPHDDSAVRPQRSGTWRWAPPVSPVRRPGLSTLLDDDAELGSVTAELEPVAGAVVSLASVCEPAGGGTARLGAAAGRGGVGTDTAGLGTSVGGVGAATGGCGRLGVVTVTVVIGVGTVTVDVVVGTGTLGTGTLGTGTLGTGTLGTGTRGHRNVGSGGGPTAPSACAATTPNAARATATSASMDCRSPNVRIRDLERCDSGAGYGRAKPGSNRSGNRLEIRLQTMVGGHARDRAQLGTRAASRTRPACLARPGSGTATASSSESRFGAAAAPARRGGCNGNARQSTPTAPVASAVRQATRAPEDRPPTINGNPRSSPARRCSTTAVQASSR